MSGHSAEPTLPAERYIGHAEVAVDINTLIAGRDHREYLHNSPVITAVETQIQGQPLDVRLTLLTEEASTDEIEDNLRFMPIAEIHLCSQPEWRRVTLEFLRGPQAFEQGDVPDYINDGHDDWENERDVLQMLAERMLNPNLHNGERRAGRFALPVLNAEDSDTVLHESTVPGLPVAEIFRRLRVAYGQGWTTPEETGQVVGILHASALDTVTSLALDFLMRQGHPDTGNLNGDAQTGEVHLFDYKIAGNITTEHTPNLDDALERELNYFSSEWRISLGGLRKLEGFRQPPIDEIRNYTPAQRQAMVQRLEEMMVQVALLEAGIDRPTVEDARTIIRLKNWLVSVAPTLGYPKKPDNTEG